MAYILTLFIYCCIYLILAQSYNLVFGLARYLSLAHIASYALGAYAAALLSTEHGQGMLSSLVGGFAVSAMLAVPLGLVATRLREDYFILGTLAFSAVVSALLVNWKSLTHGMLGIPGIPRPPVLGINLSTDDFNFAALCLVACLASLAFFYVVHRSPLALTLRAQGENDLAAQSLGKDTRAARNVIFIIASAFAGLAGALFAFFIRYIDPSSFLLPEMVFLIACVVVGGPGSFWGVCFGTVFLVLLPEPLRFLDIPSGILGPSRQLIYGIILCIALYIRRQRLFPRHRRV